MPTYEYECRKCGKIFEKFQTMSAKPVRTCPKCRGRVKRLLGTGSGIIFKGSGFYETDYRRKGTGGGDSKTEKAETKPAASSTESKAKSTSTKE